MERTHVEIVRELIGYIVTSYWGALLLIILGIYGVKWLYKQRNDEMYNRISNLGMYWQGWIGAIVFILLGIWIIILKLMGKH